MGFVFTAKEPDNVLPCKVFLFKDSSLLVDCSKEIVTIPVFANVVDCCNESSKPVFFGHDDVNGYYSAELRDVYQTDKYCLKPLRELHGLIEENDFLIAMRALQVVNWDLTHQFCGKCSNKMENSTTEFAKICPNCKHTNFPRISPAVIVAIVKDNTLLLARRVNSKMFSVIAGYVEAGEILEETVVREAIEEVGIKVKNIKYFASQPWAFSYTLMLAFTAEYESGDIIPDGIEIEDAGWFTKEDIPKMVTPGPISIAYKLIDWFLKS